MACSQGTSTPETARSMGLGATSRYHARAMRALRLALPALLPALLLAACGGPVAVEIEPPSLRFSGRSQNGLLHATPRAKGGKSLPDARCAWSSSDLKVATVTARGNDVTVTSAGPGSATVTCAIGDLLASAPVQVRVVTRVTLGLERAALELRDDRQPLALKPQAFDDQGAPVTGRLVLTRCDDEEVCRGDARGQLWPIGAGKAIATVEVDGIKVVLPVTVKDLRVDSKPKLVKKDYMEELDREARVREAKEAAAAAKADSAPTQAR